MLDKVPATEPVGDTINAKVTLFFEGSNGSNPVGSLSIPRSEIMDWDWSERVLLTVSGFQ